MDIILASASPRRRELLERLGVKNLKIIPADADESGFETLRAAELVVELSRKKALAVANKISEDCVVIGADTVVELNGDILGKPKDKPQAEEMLKKLSGREHSVFTGITAVRGDTVLSAAEKTAVTFKTLSEADIAAYIKTGEPMDKAGAYGAQGIGSLFITKIDGDFFSVMGLPVCRLGIILEKLGVSLL